MSLAELQFDESTHAYSVGSRKVPSVTQVLRQIDDLEGIPHDLLEAAAHFGRHVHQAVDLFNKGTLDEATLDPFLEPYLAGWQLFLKQTGAGVLESERRVYHRKLNYGGTFDQIVAWHTLPELVDVKSGAAVPRSVGPQTAAYRMAYLSEDPSNQLGRARYCVHLLGNGKYKLSKYTDPQDWTIFVSALNCWNWIKKT